MTNIKLLYVITKLELGGAQKQLLYTIAHIGGNFEIWLATQNEGFLLSEALSIPGLKVKLISSLVRPIRPLKDIRAFFILFRLIRREKFDIVHTHSSKAGILGRWAARLAGVPVILHTIHGFAFHDRQNRLRKNLYICFERFTAKITSRLIAVSQAVIRKGLKVRIGKPQQYQCIYYGIEKERFSSKIDKVSIKQHLGLNGRVIGTISCLKPQKAIGSFLKAAVLVKEKFPRANFLIVGDGCLRARLEKLSQNLELGENLVFPGWRHDIPEMLAAMEIFVLSSLWEGMPIAVLEAMAAGLPVVATAIDGTQEIVIDRETGFLVTPGDERILAQAITDLLEDENLGRKMGRKGQQLLSSGPFEPQRMIGDISSLYRTLFMPLVN